ncbi:MAG: pyruvate ferredoxin oxidoreductase [Chloroflexi bacterium]|nr:pyruvate ferredoxin oxidoreductase [Chloroflexota bacterium]
MPRMMLDGNGAASEALRLARVQVISAYPITPQSPIAEQLANYVAEGRLHAKYIRVESEHSALSCAIGAQLTGVRAATATSSVGLALMHEVLGVAAGCRVPIIMPVVNRALVSPWSLWCDHQDSMAERDSGWLQFFAEDAQAVLDLTLAAYRIGEDERVQLPAMICLDGFFLSHRTDAVSVPEESDVDDFLPRYQPHNLVLDPDHPIFINDLTPSSDFMEMRYQQQQAFEAARSVVSEVFEDFGRRFGRSYSAVEAYACEDAEAVLITLGSMSGTAKCAVDELRAKGARVGVLKIISFRPFPAAEIRKCLKKVPRVGVIDRSANLGAETGPVCAEVLAACKESGTTQIHGFVAGLGGRDVPVESIANAFYALLSQEELESGARWLDVRENALFIREVQS